jgi:arylsulfatase A-like enzyme
MSKSPNIIVLFADQQRWDTVGCYGQKLDVTPNLDKMAEEGVRFEHAFTCQPVCGPARSCLQTGKYATETGCFTNDIALPLGEKTIAHYFNEKGYETAYVGKWHLASTGEEHDYKTKAIPLKRRGGYRDYWMAADILEFTSHGYDGYLFDQNMNRVDFKGYRADCVTDFALDYLKNRKDEKPFFLFVSYVEPHQQNDTRRCEGPSGSKERFKDYEVPGDLVGTDGNWKENYPDYLGCSASLDYNLGRIRKQLDELDIADNTIIIYTSDHACHFMTRNAEYKRSCHESSIRIPMVINGPAFYGGKKIDNLVSLMDLPPTLLAYADIDKPSYMRGRQLQALVGGNSDQWLDEVFFQISERQVGRGIRTRKWKYSVYAPDKDGWRDSYSDTYVEQFLYDLEKDPYEKNNLVSDPSYSNVRVKLRKRNKKRIKEAEGKTPKIISLE